MASMDFPVPEGLAELPFLALSRVLVTSPVVSEAPGTIPVMPIAWLGVVVLVTVPVVVWLLGSLTGGAALAR